MTLPVSTENTTEGLGMQERGRSIGASSFSRSETEVVNPQLLRYSVGREEKTMARKQLTDKISIYIPQSKAEQKPVERLIKLGEKRDRSVNYLVVEAIVEYLEREERD